MNHDELRHALTGPFASLRTPFCSDDTIDFDGLANLIDFCIDANSKTLMLTYGDSLYSLLTDDEIAQMTRFTVERAAGRAMVIAADRQWATPKEVAFAQYCREVGADMLMVLPPDWGASCTTQTLVDHYAAVAEHIPVMLVTNLFIPRGDAFGLQTVEACLDKIDNIAAIKDDMCGPFARQMTARFAERCAIVSGGQKQHHLDIVPYGCVGYLSTFITFLPRITHEYWQALSRNDVAAATQVVKQYDMPLFDYLLQLEGGFDAGMHALGEIYGIHGGHRRRPYYTLSDAQTDALRERLQELELLATARK